MNNSAKSPTFYLIILEETSEGNFMHQFCFNLFCFKFVCFSVQLSLEWLSCPNICVISFRCVFRFLFSMFGNIILCRDCATKMSKISGPGFIFVFF